MEKAQRTVTQIEFLHVPDMGAPRPRFDLEPGVQPTGDAVLQGHVDMGRSGPAVTGDHRTPEPT